MLLRLAYLAVTNTFTVLRLLPMGNRDKDVEILALRHQITVLERQLGKEKVRFDANDRAFRAALLHGLPRDVLRRVRLLVRPDTVLCWHRDLLARHHARMSRPKHPGRPRTVHSVRTLVLRLARENPSCGYRRLHGELLVLGVKTAASTVWEILKEAGIDPAPERARSSWADFLRSQPDPDLESAAPAPRPTRIRTVLQWTRPHQGIANARPLCPLPTPIVDPDRIGRLDIRRHDRLGGVLHDYRHAA